MNSRLPRRKLPRKWRAQLHQLPLAVQVLLCASKTIGLTTIDRVFHPELVAANHTVFLAGEALNVVIDHLATLECAAADAPAFDFEAALRSATDSLLKYLSSTNVEDHDFVVSDIRETPLSLAPLQRAIASARIAVKGAFDLYTLATQTGGASWLTAEQLVYREIFDAQKLKYDPLYTPCRPGLKRWRRPSRRVARAATSPRMVLYLGRSHPSCPAYLSDGLQPTPLLKLPWADRRARAHAESLTAGGWRANNSLARPQTQAKERENPWEKPKPSQGHNAKMQWLAAQLLA